MIRIGMVVSTEIKPTRDMMMGLVDFVYTRPDIELRLFHVTIATTPENIAAFVATGVDGLVFCGVPRETLFRYYRLFPDHPPVVACLYTVPPEEEVASIGVAGVVILDNAAIGRQAADFFLGRGLRNFAFLGSLIRRESLAGDYRSAAFEARLRNALGTDVTFSRWTLGTRLPNGDYWDTDSSEMMRWIASLPLPCGVFANGDREACMLTSVCRRMNIDIPDRLEILGVNNASGFCERSNPPLSSLEPDYRACAEKAIEMLLALIDDPSLPLERRYVKLAQCKLVERGSTSVDRNRGNVVTRAREFIRLHACRGIGVPDVAAHVGVSRRLLESRMRATTGQSMLELIQKVRLESCRHLLETTNLPVAEVQQRSGYRMTANPGRVFRKVYGMSMSDYRAAHRRPEP